MEIQWISITGASSGIGKAYALKKAQKQANLILSGRNLARLEDVKAQCLDAGAKQVEIITCDYTDSKDIEHFLQFHREIGPIKRFVSCAGYGDFTDVRETKTANIIQMTEVNLIATMLLVKEMVLLMLDQKLPHAEIAMVASVAGKIYTPRSAVYAATKAGLYAFSKGLAQDLWDLPISVTCVLPGPTDTPFFEIADPDGSYFENVKAFSTTPEEVALKMDKAINRHKTEVTVPFYYEYLSRTLAIIPETGAKLLHHFYKQGQFR